MQLQHFWGIWEFIELLNAVLQFLPFLCLIAWCISMAYLGPQSLHHCIHLGNNGAAFVEILVGRSSWDSSQDYKVSISR